jgi:hypothetical protein
MEAEDIAVLLTQQLFDLDSPLKAGTYSKYFIDAKYKLPHKRRLFSSWESYWVHSLHPTFFGYSTARKGARKRVDFYDPDAPEEIRNKVAPGLLMLNPVDQFSRDVKTRFIELDGEDRWKGARLGLGMRLKGDFDKICQPDGKLTDFTDEMALLMSGPDQFTRTSILEAMGGGDDNDDSTVESSVVKRLAATADAAPQLRLYRPNMTSITEDEVQRLRRVKRAFERRYQQAMRAGLADGVRLRREQYEALRDKESAERLYRSASQWFGRLQRLKNERGPFEAAAIALTAVSPEEYEGWKQEIRQVTRRETIVTSMAYPSFVWHNLYPIILRHRFLSTFLPRFRRSCSVCASSSWSAAESEPSARRRWS